MIYIVSALVLLICILYFSRINLSKGILSIIYVLLSVNLFIVLFQKNIVSSTDYYSYMIGFEKVMNSSFLDSLNLHIFEPLFTWIFWVLLHLSPDIAFVIFVFATNLLIVIGIYRFYDDKNLALFSVVFYTYFPMFLVMSTNIIRQMFVMGLVLVMFNYKGIKRFMICIFPLIHSSSFLIVLVLFANRVIKTKYALLCFLFSIILFITDINRKLFAALPMFKRYTSPLFYNLSGSHGNRLDFLLFTLFIVAMAFVLYKFNVIHASLMNYMYLTGTLFCLLGFLAFSDRIAMYNWFFLIILFPYCMQLLKSKFHFNR